MISPERIENRISFFPVGAMSVLFNQLYEFGDFRLDPQEKILTRGNSPVELTPKGFELLTVFVENHGRLLHKDELMEKVWADSFVEESNLTFNIRQLRVILGDDAHDPKYIKTVRRHGYRFIADVRHITEEVSGMPEISEPEFIEPGGIAVQTATETRPAAKRTFPVLLPAIIVLLVGGAIFGAWYFKDKLFRSSVPILAAPFDAEKLSTNGKVMHAKISPDGKNVIYVSGRGGDRQSVWLRQLESGSNTEIIPPSNDYYNGLNISHDGNTLYFVRATRASGEHAAIYRVSIFGGIPQKIIYHTEGWTSLSPDDKKISFVRCEYREEENCALYTADADGKNERKLVARARPYRIGDNRFAPDGKSIAFAVGQSENSGNDFGLSEVNLETGQERELTSEKFFNIKNLEWLPDRSGWLLAAARIPNINIRIWQVSARTGEVEALTKDSETYGVISFDREATKLVSTQVKQNFQLRLCQTENPTACKILADAAAASIAPDGKLYFPSTMSGSGEMWSINPDGSNPRQLTNNKADLSLPIASPDNKSVYFASNRTGAAQVWRMNPDGSDQAQVTREVGGYPVGISPDGEWVYYLHGINRTLWRASVKGGTEEMVLNKAKNFFSISPDGTRAAFAEIDGDQRILTIASLADGQIVKKFNLTEKKRRLLSVAWLPDGKSVLYVSSNLEFENNILWKQPLDQDKPQQLAMLGDDELRGGISLSPDARSFSIVQGRWLHDAVLLKGLR